MNKTLMAMSNLIDALDAQARLVARELSEVTILAYVHGWRSTRIKQGQKMREKIAALRKKVGEV